MAGVGFFSLTGTAGFSRCMKTGHRDENAAMHDSESSTNYS